MGKYMYIRDTKLVPVTDAEISRCSFNCDYMIAHQLLKNQIYKVGIVYGEIIDDNMYIGWSICSENDKFDLKKGIEYAKHRYKSECINLPDITACPNRYKRSVAEGIYEVAYQLFQEYLSSGMKSNEVLELVRLMPQPTLEVKCENDKELIRDFYKAQSKLTERLCSYIEDREYD